LSSSSLVFRFVVFGPFIIIFVFLLFSFFYRSRKKILNVGKNLLYKRLPFSQLLLVDDDPHVIQFFSYFLGKRGIEVTIASDGEEALGLWKKNPSFDVVIADINMPKMSGVDLGVSLYEFCPVVLMSGDHEEVVKERGELHKCHGYFCKELRGKDFIKTVSKACESWRDAHPEKRA
jgi:CheY-like chemotaxis protein